MKIAHLGLGRMGSGIAGRIAAAPQHSLTVWNRDPGKAQRFGEKGVAVAADPAAAVTGADLVITCLFDDGAVEALFHEGSPALTAMQPNAIHLGITTVSAACANRLQALHAKGGTRYVAGPVLGRPDAAAAGKLIQLLAGDRSAILEIEPVFKLFTERVAMLPGPAGAANNQKLCVNFFLAAMIESMSEYLTLGDALDVSRGALFTFMDSAFALPGLKSYAERMFRRSSDGADGFAMAAGLKDARLIRDAARGANCPLDIADALIAKMEQGVAAGLADSDWSAVQEVTRRRAGLDAKMG